MATERVLETEAELNSQVLTRLLTTLAIVDDPRQDRGKRYRLVDILAIAILGCLCGCDNAEALEDWADKEKGWLANFLQLEHGTPGQDVFLRVLSAMNPQQFQTAFVQWTRDIFCTLGIAVQIAIDGQTHKGSRHRAKHQDPIHMVSALTSGDSLVLGQVKTEEKSNEITAIPALLKLLELSDALVSMDAMGCQVAIAQLIRNLGGDYLLGLKGNQSSLLDETEAVFQAAQNFKNSKNVDEAIPPVVAQATETDKGHGRLEIRTANVITEWGAWVPQSARWPDLKSLIAIESTRQDLISNESTTETRYYISSRVLTPTAALSGVRNHWRVENRLHWVLDVSFGQDKNQTHSKFAAENFGVIRHFALNLIRNYRGDRYSVPRRRRLCDYNVDYREMLLGLSTNAA
jgi:predicted transposase YbfD/YdcC